MNNTIHYWQLEVGAWGTNSGKPRSACGAVKGKRTNVTNAPEYAVTCEHCKFILDKRKVIPQVDEKQLDKAIEAAQAHKEAYEEGREE